MRIFLRNRMKRIRPKQDIRKGYPYIIVQFIVDFLAIIKNSAHIALILSGNFRGQKWEVWFIDL